jgi:GT2 family glycosyltransferase
VADAALRVAAIVPTLDRAADLEACLRSLAAARPGYAEIVVADQGADRSLEPLVTSLGARYLHLDRRGLSRARNAAMALASSPWLYFPDDDCTVAPDLLARVAEALGRHPRAGFAAARVRTPAGPPLMAGMDGRERELAAPADTLPTVSSAGLFVAARVIERCGAFDERFGVGAEWPSGEESDLLFRAMEAGERGVYVPDAVVAHPDPHVARDEAAHRRRARLYGRGWGALFAKHAQGADGNTFAAMQRRYEIRALGGAVLSALSLQPERARRQWQSWLGRREGWRGWRAAHGRAS